MIKTKKQILQQISNDLKNIDFKSFDPRKNKKPLMDSLQQINASLGKILRTFENANS